MGLAKSRGGAYESLIRNLDREALTRAKSNPPTNDSSNPSNSDSSVDPERPVPPVKPSVIISKNPAEILAFEVQNGKIDIKKAIEQLNKLPSEEIAKHPELRKLQQIDSIVKYVDTVEAEYGVVPPKEINDLVDEIQNGNYTPEQKKYIMDNSPKEVKSDVQKQNRIRDYGEDYTEKQGEAKKPALTKTKTSKVPEKNVFREQFGEGGSLYSKNSSPDEIYAIGKRISEDEVGSLDDLQPRSKKNKADLKREMETVARMKTAVEDYAKDRNISNDEAFNEIKDFYEQAQENPRTIEDQVGKMEKEQEQLRADYEREMKSLDDRIDSMQEKVDGIAREPTPQVEVKTEPTKTPTRPVKKSYEEYKADQIKK